MAVGGNGAGNAVIAGVVLDLGNSLSRVILTLNKRSYRFNLQNRFAVLQDNYEIPEAYRNNEKTSIFSYSDTRIAYGSIVERELKTIAERPASLKDKTEQVVTSFTLNRVFIACLRLISEMMTKQLVDVDVTFNVTVLLPPEEQENKKDEMEAMIRAITSVHSLYPVEFEKAFRIGSVSVHPEGIAALFGALYTEKGAQDMTASNEGKSLAKGDVLVRDNSTTITIDIEDGMDRFFDGYLLVIDIGAGTSDFALVLDMSLVEGSRATHNVAGNAVTNAVKAKVKSKYRLQPRDEVEMIRRAEVVEGDNVVHDISDIVTEAKMQTAMRLKQFLVEYFESKGVTPREIRGMLVAGGGGEPSLRDGVEVSPPMSDILTNFIKELAPNIAVIKSKKHPLRELNIEGAYLLQK